MKKFLCLVVAMAFLMVFPLTGCGDNKADIQAPVDGFMAALQAGDVQGLKEYVKEDAFDEDGAFSGFGTIENMDEVLAKELGMNASDLSDKTKAAVDEYITTMLTTMVKSYEIKDVKEESDGVGKVTISATFGYDPEAAGKVNVNDQVEALTNDYMNKNMTELTNIYMSEGQTALMNKVLDDLVVDILNLYTDEVMKTGETTEQTTFIVEKVDDKWLISGEE